PDRQDVEGVRHALEFGTRIRVAADPKERPMHCHHEKIVVIDDRIAFVGGIDLTTLEGDRFDLPAHPAPGPLGWHDAAVVLLRPPSDEFRVLLVLPSHPNNGGDDTRGQLADLLACDRGAGRVLACALQALGDDGPQPVYVHAKIGIVDDRWLTIGSANLNEHSLFNDTEVNLVSCEPELARATRERLWAEHLELPVEEVRGREPAELVDERWYAIAEEQLDRRNRGEPLTHRLVRLPGASRRSRRLFGPLQGLVVDG